MKLSGAVYKVVFFKVGESQPVRDINCSNRKAAKEIAASLERRGFKASIDVGPIRIYDTADEFEKKDFFGARAQVLLKLSRAEREILGLE